jgi:hypothetical protein
LRPALSNKSGPLFRWLSALGGAAVLIRAGVACFQFVQQQQASRDQLQTAHDLLISNQVSKGFEDLGSVGDSKLVARIGGIYALEGVMNTSEQYHQPVLEALRAFVRNGTKGKVNDRTRRNWIAHTAQAQNRLQVFTSPPKRCPLHFAIGCIAG